MAIFNKLPFEIISEQAPLEIFPNPFENTVHPIAKFAAEELKKQLTRNPWKHPFWKEKETSATGKMFGVLVVRKSNQMWGYIAGFSGKLADKNKHKGFVPPVYDIFKRKSFFRKEEEVIGAINRKIDKLQTDEKYKNLRTDLLKKEQELEEFLYKSKKALKKEKLERDKQRKIGLNELSKNEFIALEQLLAEASKKQQINRKKQIRIEREKIKTLKDRLVLFETQINKLKKERAERSSQLQSKIFSQFTFLNVKGAQKNLGEIFSSTAFKTPPAGAGECAGPKLLQYAFKKGWKPICMTEFWWGEPPPMELRIHNYHYPSCKGKCQPIFTHMLEGLQSSQQPSLKSFVDYQLEVLFEDNNIIAINKPPGLLSVPGKGSFPNALELLKSQFKKDEPIILHRLDMDTSGVLLFAKNKESYKIIQKQFMDRKVEKRYVALLGKVPPEKKGEVSLSLTLDVLDRPRQKVCLKHGKEAITKYTVKQVLPNNTCKVFLYPKTGRTHQLRVHMAHQDGLGIPIVGDSLYGKDAKRMYLHAEQICFSNPETGEKMKITSNCPF